MIFGPTKVRKLCNIITHNIIRANQKRLSFVYQWLSWHATFDITWFPAFVWALYVISSVMLIMFCVNTVPLVVTSWQQLQNPPPCSHPQPSLAPPGLQHQMVRKLLFIYLKTRYKSSRACNRFPYHTTNMCN